MSQNIGPIFGNGSDGELVISSNITEAPIDASCSGTAGSTSLSATNISFAQGQKVFIHQTRGTGVGQWEIKTIASYTAGTITLDSGLDYTYTDSGASQAQVRVLPQYSSVTIDSAKTYTAKAWNGDVGGILAFLCSGTVTVVGSINATGGTGVTGVSADRPVGGGYRGGTFKPATGDAVGGYGYAGEGTVGDQNPQTGSNGTGGGGALAGNTNNSGATGAGGSHATVGTNGTNGNQATGGSGATLIVGSADLTTMIFGGGGGGGAIDGGGGPSSGGNGGGIIAIFGKVITITGTVTANGGGSSTANFENGGGGAGGSILIKGQTVNLGTNLITATGGSGIGQADHDPGGNGGVGRIRVEACSLSGSTNNPSASTVEGGFNFCGSIASII